MGNLPERTLSGHFRESIPTMDRRQKKTRHAILTAFRGLLETRDYDVVTVREVIAAADIARSTFYAHFPTKDSLLRALCDTLFAHILASAERETPGSYSATAASPSPFCHLLHHLAEGDALFLRLLTREGNSVPMRSFLDGLRALLDRRLPPAPEGVPRPFYADVVASAFVGILLRWAKTPLRDTPEAIDAAFRAALRLP